MADVTKLPVQYRRPPVVSPSEMHSMPQPTDLMVWEVCPYTRGEAMECMQCPATEEHEHYGSVVRGCRQLADEACRVMLAVLRRQAAD